MVLKAARGEQRPSMRWLPVLLAFTGARLDELCGLRHLHSRQLIPERHGS
jgi:hypothetical protein